MVLRPKNFPHAVFFPNLENNHYLVNECFGIGVPSFSITDSHVNPANVFFPIPGNSKSVRSTFFYYILISKSVMAGRYHTSSSFLLSILKKSGRLVLNFFNYNLNIPTRGYFKLFFRKYLLEEMTFLLNNKSLGKNI
jgi:ribosomal protein S2